MIEEWREVFDGYYEVSDLGNIRRRGSLRLLKPFVSKAGYLIVSASVRGEVTKHLVHRVVALAFFGFARHFGVSVSLVQAICSGKAWSHVQ